MTEPTERDMETAREIHTTMNYAGCYLDITCQHCRRIAHAIVSSRAAFAASVALELRAEAKKHQTHALDVRAWYREHREIEPARFTESDMTEARSDQYLFAVDIIELRAAKWGDDAARPAPREEKT